MNSVSTSYETRTNSLTSARILAPEIRRFTTNFGVSVGYMSKSWGRILTNFLNGQLRQKIAFWKPIRVLSWIPDPD